MRINTKLIRAILGAIALAILIVGVALAAASVTLMQYQLDFVEVTKTGDVSTWTYAVTANGDEGLAMDLWALSVDKACGYVVAGPPVSTGGDRTYTSLTSYILQQGPNAGVDICSGTYNCQAGAYSVYHGYDTVTGIRGIKFFNPDQPLSAGNIVTHVFQVQVSKPLEHRVGDTSAGVAAGGVTGSFEIGPVSGPVCAPTAVSLVGFTGMSLQSQAGVGIALAAISGLALVGLLLVSRVRARRS